MYTEMSSEYEHNVGLLLAEKKAALEQLAKEPKENAVKMSQLVLEIDSLEAMYDNYNLGLNVFRRAQGGRAGLRE